MIRVSNLQKVISERNGTERILFDGLDFELGPDDRSVAIIGRSGAGKSTLLRVLAGLDPSVTCEFRYNGQLIPSSERDRASFRRRHVGLVTQRYDLIDDRSVEQNVRLGLAGGAPRSGGWRADSARALAAVGLAGFERRRPRHLSGGEAQRVAIARALVKQPSVILADEPTGALDESTESAVLELFRSLQADGTRFVIVTHSPRVAASCDRSLVLENGTLRRERG